MLSEGFVLFCLDDFGVELLVLAPRLFLKKTGSGYGGVLPSLQNLDPTNRTVHSLVVSRTASRMASLECAPERHPGRFLRTLAGMLSEMAFRRGFPEGSPESFPGSFPEIQEGYAKQATVR